MKALMGLQHILKFFLPLLTCFCRKPASDTSSNQDGEDMKAMFNGNDEYQAKIGAPLTVGMYIVRKKIGSGSFGTVHLCEHKQTKKKYAGKLFKLPFAKDTDNMNMIYSEAEVLKKLSHKNTISFVDLIFSPRGVLLVMELVDGVDLYDMVTENDGLVESFARVVFLQLMEAIKHLHSQRIVHRDIKVDNVMVDNQGIVKLVDYGLAEMAVKRRAENDGLIISGVCGTKSYWSPELIRCFDDGDGYDEEFAGDKLDIWAAGVFLYEAVSGKPLIECRSSDDLCDYIAGLSFDFDEVKFSPELKDLLRFIFKTEPSRRPSIDEILNHPWSKDACVDDTDIISLLSPSGKVQVKFADGTANGISSCPGNLLQSKELLRHSRNVSCRELSGWRSEIRDIESISDNDAYSFTSLESDACHTSREYEVSTASEGEEIRRWRCREILRSGCSVVQSVALHLRSAFTRTTMCRRLTQRDIEQVW